MNRYYCFMLLFMMSKCDASRLDLPRQVDKMLSSSNSRKPLKSIKSQDGDIIDCIHISHQPAFDHPLLKNHTIQMRPNYHPEELFGEGTKKSDFVSHKKDDNTKINPQLWHLNGRCPRGTIPIRRTNPEEIKRASSINRLGKKKQKSFPQFPSDATLLGSGVHVHSYATVERNQYYGAKAAISVWNPQVQDSTEFSLSQIWVIGGPGSSSNTIEAGWTVYPHIFGDNNTRFFTYWTSDSYQSTGCYNLNCPGFVQTNTNFALGGSINPFSAYHETQIEMTILIWKDPKQDAWWLKYGTEVVGYWPGSLFQYLNDSASLVEWGGEVYTESVGQHTTTQMGSGHFAEEGFKGASYIRNLQVVDGSNTLRPPSGIRAIAEEPNCYNILLQNNNDWGDHFFYGGPGRNPKCP